MRSKMAVEESLTIQALGWLNVVVSIAVSPTLNKDLTKCSSCGGDHPKNIAAAQCINALEWAPYLTEPR